MAVTTRGEPKGAIKAQLMLDEHGAPAYVVIKAPAVILPALSYAATGGDAFAIATADPSREEEVLRLMAETRVSLTPDQMRLVLAVAEALSELLGQMAEAVNAPADVGVSA